MVSLWILAIVSLLCISLAHRVVINLKLAKFQRDRMQCLYIAKAAIQKAINVVEKDSSAEFDMLSESWSRGYDQEADEYIFKQVKVGKGSFTISYVYDNPYSQDPVYFYGMSDEDRKVNINQASRELLVALFDDMDVGDPESLSENIIYWRGDSPQIHGELYYGSPEVPYPARKAPFKTIEELSLVKGFREDPELVEECKRFFTVYTEDGAININTASPQILKAVFISLGADLIPPGLSDRLVNNIVDFRNGDDNLEATQDDEAIISGEMATVLSLGLNAVEKGWVNSQVFPFTVKSNLFRIEVTAGLDTSKIHKDITAIINRNSLPLKVIYWHEK